MERNYPKGNQELLEMIKDPDFDEIQCRNLLSCINNIDSPVMIFSDPKFGYLTTYMNEAVDHSNIKMGSLLFEYGSDPNFYNKELNLDCPFWSLQYADDFESNDAVRLEIAKLFLEHGANPLLDPDENGETLYRWATFCNFEDVGRYYDYRYAFCDLLLEEIERRNITEY